MQVLARNACNFPGKLTVFPLLIDKINERPIETHQFETTLLTFFILSEAFTHKALGLFFVLFFFLSCWTYGASVPSGLFVPCILCGASYGRFCAALLKR